MKYSNGRDEGTEIEIEGVRRMRKVRCRGIDEREGERGEQGSREGNVRIIRNRKEKGGQRRRKEDRKGEKGG